MESKGVRQRPGYRVLPVDFFLQPLQAVTSDILLTIVPSLGKVLNKRG